MYLSAAVCCTYVASLCLPIPMAMYDPAVQGLCSAFLNLFFYRDMVGHLDEESVRRKASQP